MKETPSNNFMTLADGAEEKLERASGAVDTVMGGLSQEKYEAMSKKLIEKKVKELVDVFKKNEGLLSRQTSYRDAMKIVRSAVAPHLSDFPPPFGTRLVEKFIAEKNWKVCRDETAQSAFLFAILSYFGERYSLDLQKQNTQAGFETTKDKRQEALNSLSFSFERKDFIRLFYGFGARLRENMECTMEGDLGRYVGMEMLGGKLTINGNVDWYLGYNMHGGVLTVNGNALRSTGEYMSGGVLSINGDVATFHKSAFTETNKGTIIWKGTEIWNNGWTKEGEKMFENSEIPIDRFIS